MDKGFFRWSAIGFPHSNYSGVSMLHTDAQRSASPQGTLYIVATPIGNLGDCSRRALDTLISVDLIACEDTRHTLNLCRHFQISTPLTSYYREIENEKSEHLLRLLKEGKQIALVSDAGTPGLADPGAVLVSKARSAGITIVAIPGPSALSTALSVAGIKQSCFFFGGFPPAKTTRRQQFFRGLSTLPYPLVFLEAPHRIYSTLIDLQRILGDRSALLFRELTKIHEQCLQGPLSSLISHVEHGVKGELVLIVYGAAPPAVDRPENVDDLILWYRDSMEMSLKDAVRHIAHDLGVSRAQVYKRALTLWPLPTDVFPPDSKPSNAFNP